MLFWEFGEYFFFDSIMKLESLVARMFTFYLVVGDMSRAITAYLKGQRVINPETGNVLFVAVWWCIVCFV